MDFRIDFKCSSCCIYTYIVPAAALGYNENKSRQTSFQQKLVVKVREKTKNTKYRFSVWVSNFIIFCKYKYIYKCTTFSSRDYFSFVSVLSTYSAVANLYWSWIWLPVYFVSFWISWQTSCLLYDSFWMLLQNDLELTRCPSCLYCEMKSSYCLYNLIYSRRRHEKSILYLEVYYYTKPWQESDSKPLGSNYTSRTFKKKHRKIVYPTAAVSSHQGAASL